MKQPDVTAAWGEWIAGMGPWHVFGGLTYDPKRCHWRPTDKQVIRDGLRWCRQAPKYLGRPVEAAVMAVEYHKSGWPHLHPLLKLPGGLHQDDIKRLGGAWYTAHGYAKLELPRDNAAVAAYASKYLAKDLDRGEVLFWPTRGTLSSHQPALRPARQPGQAGRVGSLSR